MNKNLVHLGDNRNIRTGTINSLSLGDGGLIRDIERAITLGSRNDETHTLNSAIVLGERTAHNLTNGVFISGSNTSGSMAGMNEAIIIDGGDRDISNINTSLVLATDPGTSDAWLNLQDIHRSLIIWHRSDMHNIWGSIVANWADSSDTTSDIHEAIVLGSRQLVTDVRNGMSVGYHNKTANSWNTVNIGSDNSIISGSHVLIVGNAINIGGVNENAGDVGLYIGHDIQVEEDNYRCISIGEQNRIAGISLHNINQFGEGLITSNHFGTQTIVGKWNIDNPNAVFIIGTGDDDSYRWNKFEVLEEDPDSSMSEIKLDGIYMVKEDVGDTTGRPYPARNGQYYFDTDIEIPIWYNEANDEWRDATGNVI